MKKEEIYINLQGKSGAYCGKVYDILNTNGEKTHVSKTKIHIYSNGNKKYHLSDGRWTDGDQDKAENKQEVTIDQLKEILQPMGTFTPIAMKCTQEQFNAVKPKLRGLEIEDILSFDDCNYLVNNLGGEAKVISNFRHYAKVCFNRKVHETWNEEIFLKACGIEVESLEQQLQKAEAEVKHLQSLIEEENKPKVGDWAMLWEEDEETPVFGLITDITDYFLTCNGSWEFAKKITNPELIKLLENECSTKN